MTLEGSDLIRFFPPGLVGKYLTIMNHANILNVVLRSLPDMLDDETLRNAVRACGDSFKIEDLGGYFHSRCLDRGYAVKLDSIPSLHYNAGRVNYAKLYWLNSSSGKSLSSPSLCYVNVGEHLLSVPVTGVPLGDIVTCVHTAALSIIESAFMLCHMRSDGSMGPECVPGQSGSRFVARCFQESAHNSAPLSPRSRSSRKRSHSFGFPRFLSRFFPLSSGSVRGRQTLRESSEVHGYRHVLFRSHSMKPKKPKSIDSLTQKVLSLYFGQSMQGDETNQQSRWISETSPGRTLPSSRIFVFHSPIEFDGNRLHIPPPPPVPLQSGSPQVTPADLNTRTETLLNVIQDLINRHVATATAQAEAAGPDTVLSRAIRQISTQFDVFTQSILTGGSALFHEREELRRRYAPLNGHLVSRSVAVAELSRFLPDSSLEELLALADTQGVRERPLLVQLSQGEWARLCPSEFRICASMIGPTVVDDQIPLPEHENGRSAKNRLLSEFTGKYLTNTVWTIKVVLEPLAHPVIFGDVSSEMLGTLTVEDCQAGFKALPNSGLIVTKWQGLLAVPVTDSVQLTVDRSASVDDVISQLKYALPMRKGVSIEGIRFVKSDSPNSFLRELQWCSSDILVLSVVDSVFSLRRSSNEVIVSPQIDGGAPPPAVSDESQQMLWDAMPGSLWSSNETRNILSQWSNRTDDDGTLSPNSRRKRLMAKLQTSNGVIPEQMKTEMHELGVDANTEYTRWWCESPPSDEQDRPASSSGDRSAPVVEISELRDALTTGPKFRFNKSNRDLGHMLSMSGLPAATALTVDVTEEGPPSPRSPMTPVSPVNRSRKNSLSKSRKEAKLLRSTRDTRQFEFHPFDPNLMLVGSRSGVVSLVNAELDFVLMETRVDTSPILGLSWLRSHMNIALYGASSSGLVGVLKVDDAASGIGHQPIGRFHNLSSVSMNCTDDYFLVSGFSRDVLLFDLVSGQRVLELKEIHSNFINIVRFAHFSPHMFATSSFDSTCKLWDLRAPRAAVAQYATPTLNVMCCFSPLDDNLLVSGLDSNVVQLSVRKGLVPNIPADRLAASIPARNSASNYRRAVYLANGDNFITSGTDENFMRVIDSRTGISRGVRKFDGLLEAFEKKLAESGSNVPKSAEEIHLTSDGGSTGGSQLQSDPNTTHRTDEYVQSLRGHPIFPKEVGVLLYPFDRSRSSYVCTAQIPN